MDNLGNRYLKAFNVPRLTHKALNNLNREIITREIEPVLWLNMFQAFPLEGESRDIQKIFVLMFTSPKSYGEPISPNITDYKCTVEKLKQKHQCLHF